MKITVGEYYNDAMDNGHDDLSLVINYLVGEKKVLTFDDEGEKLEYYLQDRFKNRMNQLLNEYRERVGEGEIT